MTDLQREFEETGISSWIKTGEYTGCYSFQYVKWLESKVESMSKQKEQFVCEYCYEDAKPTCCDICLDGMVNAAQKES